MYVCICMCMYILYAHLQWVANSHHFLLLRPTNTAVHQHHKKCWKRGFPEWLTCNCKVAPYNNWNLMLKWAAQMLLLFFFFFLKEEEEAHLLHATMGLQSKGKSKHIAWHRTANHRVQHASIIVSYTVSCEWIHVAKTHDSVTKLDAILQ